MNLLYCKSHIDNCLIEKCSEWTCADWINLFISTVFFILGLVIIFILKPRLEINKAKIILDSGKDKGVLKITVKNVGFFDAYNAKVECCLIISSKETLHLKPDFNEFLIIKSRWKKILFIPYSRDLTFDNTRVFQFKDFHDSAKEYADDSLQYFLDDSNNKIRFRIHAQHSFSGFGKSFEQIF